MKLDVSAVNVPFICDHENRNGWDELFDEYLTEKDIQSWEKTPWMHCTWDPKPYEQKKKHTSMGSLRFCEGWLTEQEVQVAKKYRNWFWFLKDNGLLGFTEECEGCVGNFIYLDKTVDVFTVLPGYWVVKGKWVYVNFDGGSTGSAPPAPCQWDQYRWNRRHGIQLKVYGETNDKVPKDMGTWIQGLLKKRKR